MGLLPSRGEEGQPGDTLEQGKALLGVGGLSKVAFGLLGHPKCWMSHETLGTTFSRLHSPGTKGAGPAPTARLVNVTMTHM